VKALNIALLLVIAVGLYACGGGGSNSMGSSSPPSASAPPPAPMAENLTVSTVQGLTSAKDETTDPMGFPNGGSVTPSDDQTSDATVVTAQ